MGYVGKYGKIWGKYGKYAGTYGKIWGIYGTYLRNFGGWLRNLAPVENDGKQPIISRVSTTLLVVQDLATIHRMLNL